MATQVSSARLALTRRPRRLRRTESIRTLVRETRLTPDCFILPLFVCEGRGVRREISSMPGVFNLAVDEAVKEAAAAKADGVLGVLLFGLPESKDATGSKASDPDAPVQSAVRALKREVPGLIVVTERVNVDLGRVQHGFEVRFVQSDGLPVVVDRLARVALQRRHVTKEVVRLG